MDKAGTQQPEQLLPSPEGGASFVAWDWSPDGEKLAGKFIVGTTGIGYYSFAERKYVRLTDVDEYPVWLSDSRRIIFSTEGKAYLADIVTKRVQPFFDAGRISYAASESRETIVCFTFRSTNRKATSGCWICGSEYPGVNETRNPDTRNQFS